MKAPTGIDPLDRILGGGLQKGTFTLLLGAPGSGRTVICNNFIAEGLKRREPCLYVTTSHPKYVREDLRRLGIELDRLEEEGLFRLVDCYSWVIRSWFPEALTREKYTIEELSLPHVLYMVSKARSELGPGGRGVFDTLTDLFIHISDKASVVGLIRVMAARVRELGTTAIVTLDPATQEERWTRAVMNTADNVLRLEMEYKGRMRRRILVLKCRGECMRPYFTFTIRDGRVVKA